MVAKRAAMRRLSQALSATTLLSCSSAGLEQTTRTPPEHGSLLAECGSYRIELDPSVVAPRPFRRTPPKPLRTGPRSAVACVEVTVDVDGRVLNPEVIYTSDSDFAANVVEALKDWRYEPATRDGVAVAVRTLLSASFTRGETP